MHWQNLISVRQHQTLQLLLPEQSSEWPAGTQQDALGPGLCSAVALLLPVGSSWHRLGHCCLTWQTVVACDCPRGALQHATSQLAYLPKALHEHPAQQAALLPCLAAQLDKVGASACSSKTMSVAHRPVMECEVRVQDRVTMCLRFVHGKYWAGLGTCF